MIAGFDKPWEVRALRWMATIGLHCADPDEEMDKWLSEAAYEDDKYVSWVLKTWDELRHCSALEYSRLIRESTNWLNGHPEEFPF